MTTEAQRRAKKKYQKKVKQINICFYPTESEIWDFLKAKENKSGYLKNLIRKDMENGR